MGSSRSWEGAVLLLVCLTGCSRTPAPSTDTGARKAVQEYCDAVMDRDWKTAYAALHPDSRKLWTAEQFSRSAESYRRKMGFEPQKVQVRSCEEQQTQAVAHVVFMRDTAKHQRYKDGLVLQQT